MICNKNIFWLLYPNIFCVDAEEMLKEIVAEALFCVSDVTKWSIRIGVFDLKRRCAE